MKTENTNQGTRRDFIKKTATVFTGITIVPRFVLGGLIHQIIAQSNRSEAFLQVRNFV